MKRKFIYYVLAIVLLSLTAAAATPAGLPTVFQEKTSPFHKSLAE